MDDHLNHNQRFLKQFVPLIILCIIFSLSGAQFQNVFGQSNAADIFDEFCADCHSIGEGDMKGPDLLGVEQKHTEDWLIKFIQSSKTVINSGDLKAISTWEKYNKGNMPDNKLSEAEIKSLIDYIRSFNKNIVEENYISSSTNGEPETSDGTGKTIQNLNSKVNEYESKLQNIEKKLDIILEFHKKSFSARITDEEINKGKELFEGHRPFSNDVPACITCHNTFKIDTLNWNPSAYDIATAFSQRKNVDMSDIIINPVSDKMKEVLRNHELTDDEAFYITAFLQSIEKTGLKEHVKIPMKLIVFILIIIIMVMSLFDLIFTKIIKYKWITFIVFLISAIFAGNTIVVNAKNVGLSQNYAPDQPIKFSHKIHVKENKIECIFCHNSPEFSTESGVPTTNVCMICHDKIKTGQLSGQFEINKIKDSDKNKKPIEWIKIHNLPDHVFFSHAQHVTVGKIDCQTCHGDIEDMDRTSQYSTLSMGWCVKCHRESEIQFEENNYYSNHEELHRDLKAGKITKITADKIGANDCQKCHY